jgi:integrase/recombinase XerD
MNVVICSQVVLSRAPEGPLAAHIATFAKSLVALGYRAASVHRQAFLASCFSRWLGRTGAAIQDVTTNDTQRYLRCRARRSRPGRGDLAALKHFLDFLRREGVVPAEKISAQQLTAIGHCAEAYEFYLREARALARATIVNYVPFIRKFLSHRFGDGPVVLSHLCAGDVVRFVQWQAPRLHPKRAKLMTSALRSFLGYAQYCGEVAVDLTGAVPIVPNWSMTSIPRAIAPEQVRQLLASIDRRTATGRRDYAILLLLARLGLRSGEVASL